ncbi:T9SS type B sorting domain-containing protein [Spirosoma aerophilum]
MQKGYSWLFIWLLTWLPELVAGQNLIPNGSFETYRNCPRQNNQLIEATPWYNPNRATPDFYHQCFQTGQVLLPPHSGQGVGHLFFDQGWAEYFAVQLKKPLTAGECYYFEMFIATDTPNKLLTETFGAYFSADAMNNQTTTDIFPVRPQVLDRQPKNTIPRLEWQRVSGFVTATGGEQYVTIGNFYRSPAFLAYYELFVDDISLLPITLDLGKDTTLCGRKSTLLLDATTPGASDYRWSNGSTKPTLLVTRPGKYSVTALTSCKTVIDTITVDYALDFDLGTDTTLCNGQTLMLKVPPSAVSTYRWQDGSQQNTFTAQREGRYSIQVTQASCVAADSITIRYVRPPQLELGPEQKLCGAELFTIKPAVADGKFKWMDQTSGIERTVSSSGVYIASVQNDCATITDSINIDYTACDCILYAPNSFTPNDDGLNDVFLAYGCGDITITSLAIFNRWGEIVFQTATEPFQWNGYYRGEACKTGVYAWRINYNLNQRGTIKSSQQQGSLNLIR